MSRSVCYFNPVLCLERRFSCTWNMWTNKRINYLRNSSRSEVENVDISINFDKRRNIWLEWSRWKIISNLKVNGFSIQSPARCMADFASFLRSQLAAINKRFGKNPPTALDALGFISDFMPCALILYDQHEPPSALSSPKTLSLLCSPKLCFSHFPLRASPVVAVKFSIWKTFSSGTWMFHVFAQSNDFTAPNSTALGFN